VYTQYLGQPASRDEGEGNKNLVSTRRNIQDHRFTNIGDTCGYRMSFSTLPQQCAREVRRIANSGGAVVSIAVWEIKER
jgi:hypothetical protein